MSDIERPVRPEVYGALSLAARHERAIEAWEWRSTRWRRLRFIDKHRRKVQKLMARAGRLSATGATT